MDDTMSLRNNAFATRQDYIRGVRSLILHYQKLPEGCTVEEVRSFLALQRDKKGLSSSTVNLRVCGLKYYYRFVAHRPGPVVKIPSPRVQKYDTEIPALEEVKLLRRCCRDMRQLPIISLLYGTGIRVRELARLRAGDLDKHRRTIAVRSSKGKKTRVVHYGEELRSTLDRYCRARGGVPASTLLESYKEKGRPLTLRGVQYTVRQVAKRPGIKKRISPHTFRHTCAVHYLNSGGSLFHLQKLLGHEHITTTPDYLEYAELPEARTLSVLDGLVKKTGGAPPA